MIVKFNPSGTHIKNGLLKVRLDITPEPTDKTYTLHHIQVPVLPNPEKPLGGYTGKLYPKGFRLEKTDDTGRIYFVDVGGQPIDMDDYEDWVVALPHIWQTNPALYHFIQIGETTTLDELKTCFDQTINPDVLATADDILWQYYGSHESAHRISPLMRNRGKLSMQKVVTADPADLVASVNQRFASLSLQARADGQVWDIQPQTIDVGSAAENRTSSQSIANTTPIYNTTLDYNNPANATGTIDTVEVWFATANAGNNSKAGTFNDDGGGNFTCNDAELLGALSAGSKQTVTGLTIAINIGEYIGIDGRAAVSLSVEKSTSGGGGVYTSPEAQFCDPADSGLFLLAAGDILSLYGTGLEAGGGGWVNIAKVDGIAEALVASIIGVAKASIAKINGIAV